MAAEADRRAGPCRCYKTEDSYLQMNETCPSPLQSIGQICVYTHINPTGRGRRGERGRHSGFGWRCRRWVSGMLDACIANAC